MQNSQVVAYESHQLKTHEENYRTRDLELVVIIFAFKVWRDYLYGVHFEMFCDHKSLKCLFDKNELNMHQQRWMKFMEDCDFKLKFHTGKANKVEDALSGKKCIQQS